MPTRHCLTCQGAQGIGVISHTHPHPVPISVSALADRVPRPPVPRKGGSRIPCACCAYDELLSPDLRSWHPRHPRQQFPLRLPAPRGGRDDLSSLASSRSDCRSPRVTGARGEVHWALANGPIRSNPSLESHASMQAQGSAARGTESEVSRPRVHGASCPKMSESGGRLTRYVPSVPAHQGTSRSAPWKVSSSTGPPLCESHPDPPTDVIEVSQRRGCRRPTSPAPPPRSLPTHVTQGPSPCLTRRAMIRRPPTSVVSSSWDPVAAPFEAEFRCCSTESGLVGLVGFRGRSGAAPASLKRQVGAPGRGGVTVRNRGGDSPSLLHSHLNPISVPRRGGAGTYTTGRVHTWQYSGGKSWKRPVMDTARSPASR